MNAGNATCPRVLFVTSHAFNDITGTGITFRNLFRGWPAERLATVHDDLVPASSEVCRHYYVLDERELDLWAPLATARRLARRYRTPRNAASPAPAATLEASGGASAPGWARRVLGDSVPQRARLSGALERWIEDYRPEVLFTILGSVAMMELIEAIRRRFSLPVVVHLMDDWISTAHRAGLAAPLMRRRMQRLVAHFIEVAAARIAICDAMASAYESRYGRSFEVSQNTVDIGRWKATVRHDASVREPAELLYVGSIFPFAQLESLVDCARAVGELRAQGRRVTLRIASPDFLVAPHRHRLAINDGVVIEDPITDDETFYRRISRADVLLLPVNFDAASVRFIRYSMPTKVPAYLASGTPMLVYGPGEVAQVAYARAGAWGQIVERRDPALLRETLRHLLDDMQTRERLRRRAQAVAAERHDATRVRAHFQDILRRAAGGGERQA